jgi:hypothetical protein
MTNTKEKPAPGGSVQDPKNPPVVEIESESFELSGPMLDLFKLFVVRARKRGDKHSNQYLFEDSLLKGINATKRSWDYSEDVANRKGYDQYMEANPLVVLDLDKHLAVMEKFNIGGSIRTVVEAELAKRETPKQ